MKNIIKALIWRFIKLLLQQIISILPLPEFALNIILTIICNILEPYYNIFFEWAYTKAKMLYPILKEEIKYIIEIFQRRICVEKTRDLQKPLVINSFIIRSVFILPSCQNRHRTHRSVNFYFTVLS